MRLIVAGLWRLAIWNQPKTASERPADSLKLAHANALFIFVDNY
jgi:hypothetical protein